MHWKSAVNSRDIDNLWPPLPKSMAKCKQVSRGYLKQTEVGGRPSRRYGLHLSTRCTFDPAIVAVGEVGRGIRLLSTPSLESLHRGGSREDEGRKIVRERARAGKE